MMDDLNSCLDSPELQLTRLSAGYGRKIVLHDVSVKMAKGELLAVIGANGAGKSTLLKAIMGFATVTGGGVAVAGREITRLPPHERVRLGVSYLMQGGGVFPSLTVRENLDVAVATLSAVDRAAALEEAISASPQIASYLNSRAGLLSGGQKQAVAIGMMLIRRPRVLLLDEPSAGLSPRVASETLRRILDISQAAALTAIIVEQRVRQVLEIATRALILNNGTAYAETRHPSEWLDLDRIEPFIFGSSAPK